jgi:hypothetical protein
MQSQKITGANRTTSEFTTATPALWLFRAFLKEGKKFL